MKKISYLLVLGLISSSLFSCNNEEKKTNVRTINKLYEDLANSFRVSGTISEFYNDKETKSTFNTRFTTDRIIMMLKLVVVKEQLIILNQKIIMLVNIL